jgi:hypothetical protein
MKLKLKLNWIAGVPTHRSNHEAESPPGIEIHVLSSIFHAVKAK